ncbi:MAG: hypothetical protein F6J90_41420 [Moorea sp. SIOASIH]|uniref:hypothetical protein n=1 Tax=Moorena sp. SIOASIH TaxID=2607817 RepID=UPI0013B8A993|nr:hypothetical protein [Moorena sp. SIOASIH]NEO42436.1 hypothetical protein [Moorena sp. SIOASIH]
MGNCKPISYYPLLYALLKLQVKVQVSIERSAVSGQPSAVSRQPSADLTQIKQMVTCCLDAVAHGEGLCAELVSAPCTPRGNPQDRAASLIQKHLKYRGTGFDADS